MKLEEIIWVIKRNHHRKGKAITLISDFLVISKEEAKKIYQREFEFEYEHN